MRSGRLGSTASLPNPSVYEAKYQEITIFKEKLLVRTSCEFSVYLGRFRELDVSVSVIPRATEWQRSRVGLICSLSPCKNLVHYRNWSSGPDGSLVLISDFIPAHALETLLPSLQKEFPSRRLDVAVQILSGLTWLHSGGVPISHGALACGNIFIERNSSSSSSKTVAIAFYGLTEGHDEHDDVLAYGKVFHTLLLENDKCAPQEWKEIYTSCTLEDPEGRPRLAEIAGISSARANRTMVASSHKILTTSGMPRGTVDHPYSNFWRGLNTKALGFDPLGEKVWSCEGVFGQDAVASDVFFEALEKVVGIAPQETVGFQSFQKLLKVKDVADNVNMADFVQVLQWFGPLDRNDFLNRIAELTGNEWFHGNLDREESEKVLANAARDGAWLVRFGSVPGTYTLSVLLKKKDKGWVVSHFRINRDARGFGMENNTKDRFSSVAEFLNVNKKDLQLSKHVPSTTFIFNKLGPHDTASF